jgi:hypothetical protein
VERYANFAIDVPVSKIGKGNANQPKKAIYPPGKTPEAKKFEDGNEGEADVDVLNLNNLSSYK